jgi:membrane-associated phospholipid phosphatase
VKDRRKTTLWVAGTLFVTLSALAGAGLTRDLDLALIVAAQNLSSPVLDGIGTAFSTAGGLELTSLLVVGLATALFVGDRKRLSIRFLLAFLVASALEVFLKTFLPVPPVPERLVRAEDYAPLIAAEPAFPYPSGHMLRATMLLGAAWLLTRNTLVLVACGVLLLGMSASRVYMGVHWPSDVVGGALLGVLALAWAFGGEEKR